MPPRPSVMFLALAVILGALLGSGVTHLLESRKQRLNYLGRTGIKASFLTRQIEQLSAGEITNLKNRLEAELDADIVIIGLFAKDGNGSTAKSACQGLKLISEHRNHYPYSSSDPNMKAKVEAALSLAR